MLAINKTRPQDANLPVPVFFAATTNFRARVIKRVSPRSNRGDSLSSAATTEQRGTNTSIIDLRNMLSDDALHSVLLEYRTELSYRRALGEQLTPKEVLDFETIDRVLETHLPKDAGLSDRTLSAIDFVLSR